MLASLDARLVLREIGIHLTEDAFASTDLRRHPELLDAAAVVVTMTAEQKRVVGELAAAPRPVLTLRELAGEEGDIADPVGQGDHVYRACRDEIARCLGKGLDLLLALRAGERASA